MKQVPDLQIKKRLELDNPWWESGKVEPFFEDMPRRAYFDGLMKLIDADVHRAVVLMGPRRVGKTVLIFHAVSKLLGRGVDPNRIFYVSVDMPVYTGMALQDLLDLFMDMKGLDRRDEFHVFFDEIQYLKDWEIHLKGLVDTYHTVRFTVSGSAAAALRMKSAESGAGRFTEFILPPLTFAEFIAFRGESDGTDDIEKLNALFIDYLNFGGFPEAVMKEAVRKDMGRFVANDIIDKVLLRDLPSLYGIEDTQELNRLFTVLALNTGEEINIDGLSQSANVAKNTIKKYLDYLEAAFLIRRVYRVDQNAQVFKRRTHFKVYLTNPCLRAALFGPVDADDPAMGLMAETGLVAQYVHSLTIETTYYARWQNNEIDLVTTSAGHEKLLTIEEIKFTDRAFERPGAELKSVIDMALRKTPLAGTIVTTRTKKATRNIGGVDIHFVPLSRHCLNAALSHVNLPLEWGMHPMTLSPFDGFPVVPEPEGP